MCFLFVCLNKLRLTSPLCLFRLQLSRFSEKDNSVGDDNGFHFFTVLGTNLTGVFLHVKSSGLVSVDCRKVGDIISFASYIQYRARIC
jgi:hypothetical protein